MYSYCFYSYKMYIFLLIIQDLTSIFDGNNLVNSLIILPDNPTKQELLVINETLKQLFDHDMRKLTEYYQTNIAFVQKRITQMDSNDNDNK